MPGHWAFTEKPKYHNKIITCDAANVSTGQAVIDETFNHLSADETLNYMIVYVGYPDLTGHKYGASSIEVLDVIILRCFNLKTLRKYDKLIHLN